MIIKLITLLLLMPFSTSVLCSQAVGQQEESPLWWTLTNDLTPRELKSKRSDTPAAQDRFDQFTGRESASADRPSKKVKDFVSGRRTPELVTMAEAIRAWSVFFDTSRLDDKQTRARTDRQFADYELSLNGKEAVTAFMIELDRAYKHHEGLVSDELIEVAKRIHEIEANLQVARDDLWEAFDKNDVQTLSRELGLKPTVLRELLRHNYNPELRYLKTELPVLKQALSIHDWRAFQKLLLKEAAPMVTHVEPSREVPK